VIKAKPEEFNSFIMLDIKKIRNFAILAHIDHGKSTLADRMLELTGTVEKRKMKEQILDGMDIERERGITIKMAPVRMRYTLAGTEYILNLIDTPGHSDFSYEVSRALNAVEGAILLIDGTRGIQAQTLSNLRSAQKAGLTIIPAVNKIDLALPQIEKVVEATAQLLNVPKESVFRVSAKTGAGVKELLAEVIKKVPGPDELPLSRSLGGGEHETAYQKKIDASRGGLRGSGSSSGRALIFDSLYDDHKGIIANVRVFPS